ncbi:hypothetical protein I350_01407 [Cryptococcus amylolentus CBS 6273]|uniref:U4/U6 snRNA-associated-splicing factor PRP24 n=1 Tax=Cryptococcus amylolentus CBS 6273 TaxID=1296118 RepID=A0A1E3KCI0_9TREE|nr:hypothetical protein I350_01407 [Cryptococcus amylolentus CBS 6273]
MDVDQQQNNPLVKKLMETTAQLEEQPQSAALIRTQISLYHQLAMADEARQAYATLSSLIMLQEGKCSWVSYLDLSIELLGTPLNDAQGFCDVFEIFNAALGDYTSLPLILKQVKFVLSCYYAGHPPATPIEDIPSIQVGDEITGLLDEVSTRSMLQSAVAHSNALLSESQQIWDLWISWEMGLLEAAPAEQRSEQIQQVHQVYNDRLRIPHSTMQQTTSDYSSFCSTYCNQEYEKRLVQATEISQEAKRKWSGEKRFGKTREEFEFQLVSSGGDPSSEAPVYLEYVNWEANARAKPNAHGKAPNLDPILTAALFERAVVPYAKLAAQTQSALNSVALQIEEAEAQDGEKKKKSKKGKGKKKDEPEEEDVKGILVEQKKMAEQAFRAYKDAEASIWARYAAWADDNQGPEQGLSVRLRAVRAVPQSGTAWADLLQDLANLDVYFERALAIGQLVIPADRTTDLVEVFLAKAAYDARLSTPTVSLNAAHPALASITSGLEAISHINKSGDPSLKLEKFILDWAETKGPQFLDQTLLILDKPIKSRASSYQYALLRAGVEIRRDDASAARDIFEDAIARTDLDWPEAVYEAFIQFEIVHGDPNTLLQTKKKIEKEQEKLARRRAKEAAAQEQYTAAVVQGAASGAAETVINDVVGAAEAGQEPVATAEAATAPAPESVEKKEEPLKRDRENTTVLVSGLSKGITTERIGNFFSGCGDVREISILSNEESMHDDALVEFKFADAIPRVLEKDQKKYEGSPVSVSMLWRSTLFVTNFPREMDDEGIRKLFGQYGRILETRWPSRKYADSRRFCYITMDSPTSAQETLVLQGYKIPGASTNFGLTVLISDPSAKTKRSDAANSTMFVGGLNNKSTENDVRGLFKEYGTIGHVKLGWDPVKKICKGFAFVEMSTEAEAKAALALHGTQHKGKYLKVEISDPNHANKKPKDRDDDKAAEKRSRSVRLHNLPENTQEGLLQQALEKIMPVKRLELFAKNGQALAELDSPADAGKLLMRTEDFIFGDRKIDITPPNQRSLPIKEAAAGESSTSAPAAPPGPSTMFAPRATRRALAKPRPTAVAAAKAVASSSAPTVSQGQSDFRAFVDEKNKQREANLQSSRESGEKRKLEEGDGKEGEESKKARTST